MTIVPVTPLTGTLLELAHTDPDAAVELLRYGLYESLCDQIDANRASLDAEGDFLIAKRAEQARVHLLRTYVGKALDSQTPPDGIGLAKNLAIIDEYVSKGVVRRAVRGAIAGAVGQTQWDPNEHRRGAGGRFVDMTPRGRGAGGTQKEMNRDKGMEIADAAAQHEKSGHLDQEKRIGLRFEGGHHDPERPVQATIGTAQDVIDANTKKTGTYVIGAAYDSGRTVDTTDSVTGNRGAYDAMNRLVDDPEMARRYSGSQFASTKPEDRTKVGQWGSNNARDWNNLSEGTDRQSYRRMEMTGSALRAISSPGSNVHSAGAIAQIIGNMGPEAEKILGPGVKRTAYRYRGTEKRPDRQMLMNNQKVNNAARLLDRRNPQADEVAGTYLAAYYGEQQGGQTKRGDHFGRTDRSFTPPPREPDQVTSTIGWNIEEAQADGLSPEQMAMRMRGDMVATSLIPVLPKAELTALSQASGDTPPSTGVMINASGQIVSQAQGFNGDHYLPFDLKNLRGLQGGQYVRTRSNGGPTTEDIYTGLLSGARQMQVVSNSGVYTVEFDQDLRGGRRYSDKATKMVRRYAQILDRISTEQVNSQDLPPEDISRIYRESMEAMNWDKTKGENEFTAAMAKERLRNANGAGVEGLTGQENIEEKIDAEFKRRADLPENAEMGRSARDSLHREVDQEIRSKQVKTYKLDGPGYATALATLQNEFPYYIRDVKYEKLPEFKQHHGMPRSKDKPLTHAKDKAYVAPGQTAMTGAAAGYVPKEKGGTARAAGGRKTRDASAAAAFERTEEEKKKVGGGLGTSGGGAKDVTGTAASSTRLGSNDKKDVVFGEVSITPAAETKSLHQMTGKGSIVNASLAKNLRGFFNQPAYEVMASVGDIPPVAADPVTSQSETGYGTFPWHKWHALSVGDEPIQMSSWLLSDATNKDRESVISYVKGLKSKLNGIKIKEDNDQVYDQVAKDIGLNEPDYEQRVNATVDLIRMGQGFTRQGEKGVLQEPASGGEPTPLLFPELDGLGNIAQNYERFENRARQKDLVLRQKIDEYGIMKPADIAAQIQAAISKYNRDDKMDDATKEKLKSDITRMQFAWSYVATKQMALKIAAMDPEGAGGEADPKGSTQSQPSSNVLGFPTDKVKKTLTTRRQPLQVRDLDTVSWSTRVAFHKALARR